MSLLHFHTLTVIQFGIGCMVAGLLFGIGAILLVTMPQVKSNDDLESARAIKERWKSNLPAIVKRPVRKQQ